MKCTLKSTWKTSAFVKSAAVAAALLAGVVEARAQTPILKIRGETDTDGFGLTMGVAALDDVDGDGFNDLLIGSRDDATFGAHAGKAQVRSGRDGSLIREHFGAAAGDTFGMAVAAPGDVDGDGVGDYTVAAPKFVWFAISGIGYVEVFSGATGALLHRFDGTQADSNFGGSLGAVGDIDGDGHDDVFLSAGWQDTTVTDGGETYIYSGADGTLLWSRAGDDYLDLLGYDADTMGDLDGDGGDDFVIGNVNERKAGAEVGQAQVISGKSGTVIFEWWGGLDDDFGSAVANGGDIDADGVADVIVGSYNYDYGPSAGEVHVYSGKSGTEIHCLNGSDANDGFGFCVDGVGDLDQDGYGDFVVTLDEYVDYVTWEFVGKAIVYSGRRALVLAELETGIVNDLYGSTCESMGDLDGDGLDEIYVGAPERFFYDSEPAQGTVFVYTMKDCFATATNYGAGWPGTLGVPSFTAVNPPVLGEPLTLDIGNSLGAATPATLFLAFAEGNIPTTAGGTILVSPPWILLPLMIPATGLSATTTLPSDILLCGFELDLQVLEADPGASQNISFTAGLKLVLGG